ncbi:MAG: short-chain dehydrogenase/reductase, partial [Mycobacterium sp.]|nr:short-chain dehydrogenase/reductase [Mycobacterium sp.]
MSNTGSRPSTYKPRVVVVSGGTDGMGRALALGRARQGDHVIVIGSNPDKGQRVVAEAEQAGGGDRVRFIKADLSSIAETRRAIREIASRHESIDALCLFANRQSPQRVLTSEGLERTFALYYLSRYVLSHELAPLLGRSVAPVIVNVAGVGMTKGEIHWDDLQLEQSYSTITAQLQAGRANDLLGVAFAGRPDNAVRYVLYHPGFTKSGDLTPLPAAARVFIRTAAALGGKKLPLTLKTLDPANAERLSTATQALLTAPGATASGAADSARGWHGAEGSPRDVRIQMAHTRWLGGQLGEFTARGSAPTPRRR